MQLQTKLDRSFDILKTPMRRYKTFMIDEILSDSTCNNYEKQSFNSLWPFIIARFPPLYFLPAPRGISTIVCDVSHARLPHASCPMLQCPDRRGVSAASEFGVNQGSCQVRKPRRCRTTFSELQLISLERKFQRQKYLSTPDRVDVAQSLGLTQLQVKTWYQNRRMKWKKTVLKRGQVLAIKPKGRPKKNSIPSMREIEAAEGMVQRVEEEEGQWRTKDLPGLEKRMFS